MVPNVSHHQQRTLCGNTELHRLRANYEGLSAIIDKQEKQIRYLETRATLLSMFYVTFLPLNCLAITILSRNPCRNWWKLLSLSLIIAFLFALNFINTVIKYLRTLEHLDLNVADQHDNYNMMISFERKVGTENHERVVDLFETQSLGIHMNNLKLNTEISEAVRKQKADMYQRYTYIFIVVASLTAYTILAFYASHSFFCGG